MARCLTLLFLLICSDTFAAEPARIFRAGAYAIDVTPRKFPVSVNGGMSDRQATLANDPLHARCLVLDDGVAKIALVIVDSCMIPREVIEKAKARAEKLTKIPASHMLIAATHTHSAPTLRGAFQSEPNVDYIAYLSDQIAEGIARADKNRMEANIGWGSVQNPTQLFNRRWKRERAFIPPDPFGGTTDQVQMNPGYSVKGLVEPAGPVDPEVSVLAVRTKQGKPIALLANYSLHYVGGYPQLSADYFGAFAERVAQLLGEEGGNGPFVGIMSNGTSGDVNNINFGGAAPNKQMPGEQIKLVADSVARSALDAYKKIEFHDHVPLFAAVKDITLGVRKPSDKEIERANKLLKEQKDPKNLVGMPAVYARETLLMSKFPDTVVATMQALRIGELGIAAIPCEVFTEIGLEIKKRSPLKTTFTIELANGYNGYLPTPAQHELGGYETWRARSSYLEVNASRKVTDTVLELLKQVAGEAALK